MVDLNSKDYVVIVQCHIVKQRCSGYYCEKAFTERTGGFADYPAGKTYRKLNITCGGCCGRAVHRKLTHLVRCIGKREQIGRERIVVQLSSCITKDNYHATPCPHIDYLKGLIAKIGLDILADTHISEKSQQRREAGLYSSGA